jgi:hypothetical protein
MGRHSNIGVWGTSGGKPIDGISKGKADPNSSGVTSSYNQYSGPGTGPGSGSGTGGSVYTGGGSGSGSSGPCNCTDVVAFDNLLDLVSSLYTAIETYFPITGYIAPAVASMGITATMTFSMYARLEWRKQYPNVKFQKLPEQILQIKFIYSQYGRDWNKDPLSLLMP